MDSPELAVVWWDRDVDGDSLKKARKQFTGGRVVNAIKKVEPQLGEIYATLYERTIQYGGHPNEKTVSQSLRLDTKPGRVAIDQLYLQGDGLILDHWIRSANQIGICVMKIFDHVHRERFEGLGVRSRMDALAEGL